MASASLGSSVMYWEYISEIRLQITKSSTYLLSYSVLNWEWDVRKSAKLPIKCLKKETNFHICSWTCSDEGLAGASFRTRSEWWQSPQLFPVLDESTKWWVWSSTKQNGCAPQILRNVHQSSSQSEHNRLCQFDPYAFCRMGWLPKCLEKSMHRLQLLPEMRTTHCQR